MYILFDLISVQGCVNGGGEYTKRIFRELSNHTNVNLVGLYDSINKFIGEEREYYKQKCERMVDINEYDSIAFIINKYRIDTFFIGILQRFSIYNLGNLSSCRTIVTLHDVCDLSNETNSLYKKEGLSFRRIKLHLFQCIHNRIEPSGMKCYEHFKALLSSYNCSIITVSEYSQKSIIYFLPYINANEIKIFYPPLHSEKIACRSEKVENSKLKSLIENHEKFFLMLGGNRPSKNAKIVYRFFDKFKKQFPEYHLLDVGGKIPYLSQSDLDYAYEHAWAFIYPSLLEGFGYPPVEAMKYSTPVLSSNVCSMPEVLGDAPLYFSPFYEEDLFFKVLTLMDNYEFHSEKSRSSSVFLKSKMDCDLDKIINLIIS